MIRLVQEARKASGFEVSDRIVLTWAPDETEAGRAVAEAIEAHSALIAEEVLAVEISLGHGDGSLAPDDRHAAPGGVLTTTAPGEGRASVATRAQFGDAELGLNFTVRRV